LEPSTNRGEVRIATPKCFELTHFAGYIEGPEPLVSSAIQIYEIYKIVKRDLSEDRAVAAVSALRTTTIEPLTETLALEAADVALEYGLAMADAIIFATQG
jgi:predicted nucleic acid-binding protein